MAVTLDAALLDRYPRFSLYNSPYAAHDAGAAVDLYPEAAIAATMTATPRTAAPLLRRSRARSSTPGPSTRRRNRTPSTTIT